MDNSKALIQKIRKQFPNSTEVAIRYYTILSVLNNLKLTPREIQLMAFTATRGTISSGGAKQQFIQQFGSSRATISNMIFQLSKKGLLVKDEDGKTRVHPKLRMNFSIPISLVLSMSHEN